MGSQELRITASDGVPYVVRFVAEAERGGEGMPRYDGPQAAVQFYDARYDRPGFAVGFGQFVGSYYASTLAEGPLDKGLDLQGGVSYWKLDGASMAVVRGWIRDCLARQAEATAEESTAAG